MLSKNIDSLRTGLAKFVDAPVMVDPALMVRICVLLDAMRRDAETMETALHAPMVHISDLVTGKVVPFNEQHMIVLAGEVS